MSIDPHIKTWKVSPETAEILIYGFSALMIALCYHAFSSYRRLSTHGQKVQGKVTEVWEDKKSERKARYSYEVAGKTYIGSYPKADKNLQVNDKVMVVYNPMKPSHCVIEGRAELYSNIALVAGLGFIALCVFVYYRN